MQPQQFNNIYYSFLLSTYKQQPRQLLSFQLFQSSFFLPSHLNIVFLFSSFACVLYFAFLLSQYYLELVVLPQHTAFQTLYTTTSFVFAFILSSYQQYYKSIFVRLVYLCVTGVQLAQQLAVKSQYSSKFCFVYLFNSYVYNYLMYSLIIYFALTLVYQLMYYVYEVNKLLFLSKQYTYYSQSQ